MFGGLSTHYRNDPRWMTWRTFMDRFFNAGGAPYDKFAIHPYFSGGQADDAGARRTPSTTCPRRRTTWRRRVAVTRRFWITEFGYETGALTPTKQGERLREALTQVVKWDFVERLFVFCWMDFLINEPNPMTAGLNYADGRPKVSRAMLKNLVRSHD